MQWGRTKEANACIKRSRSAHRPTPSRRHVSAHAGAAAGVMQGAASAAGMAAREDVVGARVLRKFCPTPGTQRRRWYAGSVTKRTTPVNGGKGGRHWFLISYEDGDMEELQVGAVTSLPLAGCVWCTVLTACGSSSLCVHAHAA